MSDPGLTTPVQPVRAGGNRGRGVVAIGLALLAVVGLLAWHPWVGQVDRPPIGLASVAPSAPQSGAGSLVDPSLLEGPITGILSSRVAAEWSIVAFVRADPVSGDPLDLLQHEVTVFLGPVHPPISRAPEYCDTVGPTGKRSAAELPTGEVRYLGIAFPADQSVVVDGVVSLGEAVGAIPVAFGSPTDDPVRMFGFPGGGPWPDGLFRFDVVTPDGPPAQLYACIRP